MNIFNKRRTELKMSKEQLAERSGVTHCLINHVLDVGVEHVSVATARVIAEALGLAFTIKEVEDVKTMQKREIQERAQKIVDLCMQSLVKVDFVSFDTIAEMKRRVTDDLADNPLWS